MPEEPAKPPEKDVLIAKIGETNDRDEIWIATAKELLAEDKVWIIAVCKKLDKTQIDTKLAHETCAGHISRS